MPNLRARLRHREEWEICFMAVLSCLLWYVQISACFASLLAQYFSCYQVKLVNTQRHPSGPSCPSSKALHCPTSQCPYLGVSIAKIRVVFFVFTTRRNHRGSGDRRSTISKVRHPGTFGWSFSKIPMCKNLIALGIPPVYSYTIRIN